jgi:biopolymer transport protein ExbD
MKIRTHRDSTVSLESFAITDIILNMFIFFFTSFSLVYTFNPSRESRIIVKLPQAAVKTPVDQTEPIVVAINSNNEVFLDNRPMGLIDLQAELQSLIASDKKRSVIVRADKEVVFDHVVQVLAAARNAGVERLDIAVEEQPPAPPTKP